LDPDQLTHGRVGEVRGGGVVVEQELWWSSGEDRGIFYQDWKIKKFNYQERKPPIFIGD
jgi:hypothetical protein